jgi:hypothetical protein
MAWNPVYYCKQELKNSILACLPSLIFKIFPTSRPLTAMSTQDATTYALLACLSQNQAQLPLSQLFGDVHQIIPKYKSNKKFFSSLSKKYFLQ